MAVTPVAVVIRVVLVRDATSCLRTEVLGKPGSTSRTGPCRLGILPRNAPRPVLPRCDPAGIFLGRGRPRPGR